MQKTGVMAAHGLSDSEFDPVDGFHIDMDGEIVIHESSHSDSADTIDVPSIGFDDQNRFYITPDDLHNPTSLRGMREKILTVADVNHLFVGKYRDEIRAFCAHGCIAVLRPEHHKSGVEGHVWINPNLRAMMDALELSFVLRIVLPDASMRQIPLHWEERGETDMTFGPELDTEITAVTSRSKDVLSVYLHLSRRGEIQDMILATATIQVGELCAVLPMDYTEIHREMRDPDDGQTDVQYPPLSQPPMDPRQSEPSSSSDSYTYGQKWTDPKGETQTSTDGTFSYKICVAFDPVTREQQEDELERIRIDLRHRSRDVVQMSAKRVVQGTRNFSSSTTFELMDDAFAVYAHRRLHDPVAFRHVQIPYEISQLLITDTHWAHELHKKKTRKRKEEHRKLSEAMDALQLDGRIYRNARITEMVVTCPRNIVMTRIGIIMDMYRDTTSDLDVIKTNRKTLIQRPPSRLRLPPTSGNGTSMFTCITCVSIAK
jgi:hypothetical protein